MGKHNFSIGATIVGASTKSLVYFKFALNILFSLTVANC
jgi:hypothetical protein